MSKHSRWSDLDEQSASLGNSSSPSPVCLLVPWYLLERTSERNLVLLSASPAADVQSDEDGGIRCMGET
jgi:hypothetical protein